MNQLLRSPEAYAQAMDRLRTLMAEEGELPASAQEELEFLAVLVAEYESKVVSPSEADPIDVLQLCLDQNSFTERDLATCIGSQPLLREVLARKRPLDLGMVQRLHRNFQLPLEVLVRPVRLAQAGEAWVRLPARKPRRPHPPARAAQGQSR